MNQRIAVGKVVKCVGLKGEVKVIPLTDDLKRFMRLKAVWVGIQEPLKEFTVESVRIDSAGAVLKLKEIGDRGGAEGILEKFLFVEQEDAVQPQKGSFFAHEIIGLSVKTSKGRNVGVIEDVWKLPANDLWVVRNEGVEILIPAVKAIVQKVDLNQRVVIIEEVEGLIELNAH